MGISIFTSFPQFNDHQLDWDYNFSHCLYSLGNLSSASRGLDHHHHYWFFSCEAHRAANFFQWILSMVASSASSHLMFSLHKSSLNAWHHVFHCLPPLHFSSSRYHLTVFFGYHRFGKQIIWPTICVWHSITMDCHFLDTLHWKISSWSRQVTSRFLHRQH